MTTRSMLEAESSIPHFIDLGTSWGGGGEWSASRPGRFTLGERAPGTHWIGGWMGPRAGLEDVEKVSLTRRPRFTPQESS
jgi:hypothetical protein